MSLLLQHVSAGLGERITAANFPQQAGEIGGSAGNASGSGRRRAASFSAAAGHYPAVAAALEASAPSLDALAVAADAAPPPLPGGSMARRKSWQGPPEERFVDTTPGQPRAQIRARAATLQVVQLAV